jgi:hypothetical protein
MPGFAGIKRAAFIPASPSHGNFPGRKLAGMRWPSLQRLITIRSPDTKSMAMRPLRITEA